MRAAWNREPRHRCGGWRSSRGWPRPGCRWVVLVSPLIPGLTDPDLERILELAAQAGASRAGSILIRLPLEVAGLFEDWLRAHYPERAGRVLSLIGQCRGGRLNDPSFGSRMRGSGPVADLLAQRFRLAARRLGLDPHLERPGSGWDLDSTQFRPPDHPEPSSTSSRTRRRAHPVPDTREKDGQLCRKSPESRDESMGRPRLFVSAVSSELGGARRRAAAILNGLGYDNVSEEDFPTGYGELRRWLAEPPPSTTRTPWPDPDLRALLLHPVRAPLCRHRAKPAPKRTWVILMGPAYPRDRPWNRSTSRPRITPSRTPPPTRRNAAPSSGPMWSG